jgi:hypothetical protein
MSKEEVEFALLKKRVKDLEDWKKSDIERIKQQTANSKKLYWVILMAAVSTIAFVVAKTWEKIWE